MSIIKTHIAKVIDDADLRVRYDENAKRVLANRDILARIFKLTVAEVKDYTVDEIKHMIGDTVVARDSVESAYMSEAIMSLNTEDKKGNEGEVFFDILTYLTIPNGKRIETKVIIDVEAQHLYDNGYDLVTRGIYYGARLISAQKDTEFSHSNYQDIKKVYSIWICVDAPEKSRNTVTEYSIRKNDIAGEFTVEEYFDILSVVMVRLGGEPDAYESGSTQKLLTTLFSENIKAKEKKERIESEFDIPMTRKVEREVGKMGSLGEGIYQRGIRKGVEQGIQQGVSQFVIGAYSSGRSAKEIADFSGISLNEIEKIISINNENQQTG